ncbi:GNAT family N-acetyltransferase [Streptomyces sp. NPDC001185]|uniref:GNAT family N-acetyltransferase n=1 Tax=Streptomyces sp. NPDC001185 TaxID=3154380 RepID=UPI003325F6EA
MPDERSLTIVEADDDLWRQYATMARRGYGHPVPDITRLRPYADARVAVRGGRVVAGGLGLPIPQFFGGQSVPSASMACACVAPEERGSNLTVSMIAARLRPLQERGAVLATIWTTSTRYARRLGWEAPATVFTWTVPTDQLRNSFDPSDLEISHAAAGNEPLQRELAARWNGPWSRPGWWAHWQQQEHPDLTGYQFNRPGQPATGVLSLAFDHHPVEGRQLVVHDFWAADAATAGAMLAFLGRHSSRIATVLFQRTGLPPAPMLLHHLHRAGAATARSWHPWMLRVLDLSRAVRLRGWPDGVSVDLPIEVVTETGDATQPFDLRIAGGTGELTPSVRTGRVTLTRGQFAVWYAGGYRTAPAAQLAGVRGDPQALAHLVRSTADLEPWLSEYF